MQHYWLQKTFELKVLGALIVFTLALVAFDAVSGKAYTKEVLPLLLPVFSFLLGMGAQKGIG